VVGKSDLWTLECKAHILNGGERSAATLPALGQTTADSASTAPTKCAEGLKNAIEDRRLKVARFGIGLFDPPQ